MQAPGGHPHASMGARREAHRTPGASSAAMVRMARNRMAIRMYSAWKPKKHYNRFWAEWNDARGKLKSKRENRNWHREGSGLPSCKLSGGFMEGALAARVFVGAKGFSNLPPRVQGGIWAGQIAALEGSGAILFIGHPGKSLRGFMIPPFPQEWHAHPAIKKGSPLDPLHRTRCAADPQIKPRARYH